MNFIPCDGASFAVAEDADLGNMEILHVFGAAADPDRWDKLRSSNLRSGTMPVIAAFL